MAVASCIPGARPAIQVCALTRNRTGDLSVCGKMPTQLSHTSQEENLFLICTLFYKMVQLLTQLIKNIWKFFESLQSYSFMTNLPKLGCSLQSLLKSIQPSHLSASLGTKNFTCIPADFHVEHPCLCQSRAGSHLRGQLPLGCSGSAFESRS